jgi:hypothetical protein
MLRKTQYLRVILWLGASSLDVGKGSESLLYSPSGLLDEEMLPSELDQLCQRLQIDPKDFGLVLH